MDPTTAPTAFTAPNAPPAAPPDPNVPPEHELAERAYRLAASIFDSGLVFAVWVGATVASLLLGLFLPDLLSVIEVLSNLMALAGFSVLGLAQWSLLTTDGTTLGKRVVGVRVVKDGGPPGFVAGVLVRRLLPRLAVVPTLGLSLVLDAIPAFSPDRRCVHDRIAGTFVVLDPKAREGDAPIGGQELWVRRGVGFAQILAVWSLAVASLFAAIVFQNLVFGLSDVPGGWLGTAAAGVCALALLAAGTMVYDGRPVGVIAVVVAATGTMLLAGLWFAYLTWWGALSVLPWVSAAFAGQLALVAGLFVGPATRIAVARQALHEQSMMDEFAVGSA